MSDSIRLDVDVPVYASVDVLVVGAGPAGIAAAISSARRGARTMLVERHGYVGGNLTAGLVGPCMTSYSLDGHEQLIRGVFEELVLRLQAAGAAIHPSLVQAGSAYAGFIVYGHDKVTPFEPEAMKAVAAEMCLEAGVELLFHSMFTKALVDGDKVNGVVVANKSGLQAIRAKVVVDCSADGDVAAQAGARYHTGRDHDGLTQPMTLFFRVGGVDDEAVERYVRAHRDDVRPFASIVEAARSAGKFTIPRRGVGLYRTLREGVWRVNATRVQQLDGTSAADLTAAEIAGRRQVCELMSFFKEWLPGFERCYLVDTAAVIGVRETRRIVGEYTLTLDDLSSDRKFPDVVALCGYPVDIHSPTGTDGGVDEASAFHTANAYQIPYRALVPVDVDQLLVAGRCISATHEALAAVRVMPPAFAMGQAAGTAAAMSVAAGLPPRAVDTAALQAALLKSGAYLGADAAIPVTTR